MAAPLEGETPPGGWHVVPMNDLREHDPSPECWCRPDEDGEVPGVWRHHAADGREAYEQGRKRH